MVGLLKQLTIPHMSSFLDLLVHSFDDSDGDTNNVDIKSKKRLKSNNMNLAIIEGSNYRLMVPGDPCFFRQAP